MGGFLEMANARLYPFWGDLTEALRTGKPQNEIKHGGEADVRGAVQQTRHGSSSSWTRWPASRPGNFQAFAEKFDFSPVQDALRRRRRHRAALDARRAGRIRTCAASAADLPPVEPIAAGRSRPPAWATASRPRRSTSSPTRCRKADVITMGMILHDWNLEKKMHLVKAAYDALPPGGAFVVIENIIDDARRENAFGLMMSLNMLIEFGDAFDFTGADFAVVPGGRLRGRRSSTWRARRAQGSRTSNG